MKGLRTLVAIVLSVGLVLFWLVAINVAFSTASSASLMTWLPEFRVGTGFIDDNRQRAQAAAREYKGGQVRRDDYLVALFGISNVREGVRLDILASCLGPHVKVLAQAGSGTDGKSLVENAALLSTDLKPDVALIGIAPLQMLDTPSAPLATWTVKPSAAQRIKQVVKESAFWVSARRIDLVLAADGVMQQARADLFHSLGTDLSVFDTRSPWRPMARTMLSEHVPDVEMKNWLTYTEWRGISDRSRYIRSRQSAQAVSSMIRQLKTRGTKVIVFLTPDHSMLRTREPADVVGIIADQLRTETGDQSIEVLDFRASVGDEGFADPLHLNTSGGQRFSAILGKTVSPPDRSRPPLMAR